MAMYAFRRMREQNKAAKKAALTLIEKPKTKRKAKPKKQENGNQS
tara:strand:+ start:156 stop:290 length:135 start_codon:yes stop_codon:yes gene_type:complete